MGTLLDLKTRIATELNRSDLTSVIADQVERSIEKYAGRRFWFNESSGTRNTVAGTSTITAPTGLRVIDELFVTINGVKHPLCERSLADITDWLGQNTSAGQPTDYAYSDATITLFRTPDAIYTITAVGIFDLTLSSDGDSNAWTEEAEDLIAYDAMERIARIKLRNSMLANEARQLRNDALNNLMGETARRLSGRVKASF